MFYKIIRSLKRIIENPYLNIAVGLILLFGGIDDAVEELKALEEFDIGVHHGVILFAIMHVLKTLPDVFEGLEYIDKVGQEKKE